MVRDELEARGLLADIAGKALSSEVGTGSREESASKIKSTGI